MPELEDLRNRPLKFTFDVLKRSKIEIEADGRLVGELWRTSFWRNDYLSSFAGIDWKVSRRADNFRSVIVLDFATNDLGLAKAQRHGDGFLAEVDGSSAYNLVPDEPGRAVWRDFEGFSAVSFQQNANPRMEFRRIVGGSIHVFEACTVAHAPILVLLGIVAIVYEDFFCNRTVGVIDIPGTNARFD